MEVTVSDWTLVSVGPAHLVSGSRERVFRSHDQMLGRLATGRWRQGLVLLSGSAQSLGSLTRRWQGPVVHDRTRPVGKKRF